MLALQSEQTIPPTLSEEHARGLLEKRRLSRTTCDQLGIGSQGPNLTFDYLSPSKSLLFRKFRGPGKNFWITPKGAALCLWNLPALGCQDGHGDTLILTEGELDAASCHEVGYCVVASVPNGAPPQPGKGEIVPAKDKQFQYLWNSDGLIPELRTLKRIVLFTDDDAPGHILRDELAVRLGADRCFAVVYPDGCKDANEILVKHGANALIDAIEGAFPIVPDRLTHLNEIPVVAHRERFDPGWKDLKAHLILCPPELVTVTGRPGSGKSQFAVNWLLNISRHYGVNGAIIQLEDDLERTRSDLLSFEKAWVGAGKIAPGWIDERIWLSPPSVAEDDNRDLEWLQRTIWEAATRHACKWVVIDPWNEIEHMWDRTKNEAMYINDALRDIKRMARRYAIAIVIVAHPDKAGGRNESIDDMTLYSISGGSAWKNKSDHGIIVEREKNGNTVTSRSVIKIDKSKNHSVMGIPGYAILDFDTTTRLYKSTGEKP